MDKTAHKETAYMLALNANRKKIQQMYSEKTGKAILMKYIHNMATRAKQQKKLVDSGTTTCSSPDRVKNLSEWIKSQFPALHTTISENQKWKESREVFQVAQSILSKFGVEQYKTRLACVHKLVSLW